MFVCADVSVGVGAFVCVCKIQLQDPSQSIASVERPAGAKHILQPDKHPRTTKTADVKPRASTDAAGTLQHGLCEPLADRKKRGGP